MLTRNTLSSRLARQVGDRRSGSPFVAGITCALLATVLWSFSAIIIDRLGSDFHLTPLQISTWRVLLVLPVLAATIVARRPASLRLQSQDLPLYLIYGVVGIAISYVAWATSVQINRPAVAVALSFSAQAFVALGDRLLFRTRLSALQMTAVAVNLLACGVVADLRNPVEVVHSPIGLLVGLANGLAFASYTLVGRAMARTGRRDPLTTLFYTFGFGGLALVLWGSVVDGPAALRVSQNALGWLLLVALALGPTLGAYALYNASLRSLPATVASIVTTLEPLLVALLAIVLLGRTLQPSQWIGMVLMVGSVIAVQMGAQPAVSKSTVTPENRER